MLWYPHVDSKKNQKCIETAQSIHALLLTWEDRNPRAIFTSRDLKAGGVTVPNTLYRLLRNRGWIERLNTVPSSAPMNWRLSISAIRWLESSLSIEETGACCSGAV